MVFRVFRLVVGVLLIALSAWLVVSGLVTLWPAVTGGKVAGLAGAALQVVAGLFVLGAYYYSLWADSPIRRSLENIFAIPELLRKLAFTLALLCIYRVGFHVPLPGVDQEKISSWVKQQEEGAFGQAMAYYSMLTGGTFQRMTLFGMGIMPYITASIIFQLLATMVPALEKLQKEGPAGYKKIQEYTRYATVLLCIIQATVWMRVMVGGGESGRVYSQYAGSMLLFFMGICGLTTGTIFLMWLGEQIDEYGIGNGISLLIMAGIVARMPAAIQRLSRNFSASIAGVSTTKVGPITVLVLILLFIFVIAGAILITQGQRRIPIQQAKQTRGRRVYGGQRHYLPLRVNHGGVMPIIFASSLMLFPNAVFGWLANAYPNNITGALNAAFRMDSYLYHVCYIVLIFFFAYFWTTVQFRPKEMAEQLQDYGSFIPGLRPGRRTAEYLERVMERITYCGAAFLAVIAVIPQVVAGILKVDPGVSAFLGGTGLLITVSVALDLVQRIEANLVMRNYGGFLGGSARIKGAYG